MEIAAAIWMFLILSIAAVVAVFAVPRRPEPAPVPAVDDDLRYAAEVAVAADRAALTAQRAREVWEAAEGGVDVAWTAYEEADREARRTAAAAVFPVQRRRRVKGENAERERFLHRAALTACREREISMAQLNDVLAHRGWNARLHPATQESALRAAVRDHRYDLYLRAAEQERAAWAEAERAAVALRSLRTEACMATVRHDEEDTLSMDVSWWSRQWSTAEPVRAAAA